MHTRSLATVASLLVMGVAGPLLAASARGFRLDVVVDGATRPEHSHRGTVYVEALAGREYTLRLHNPLGCRVAVALAVDGLNTIDARHSDARSAAKWVIEPYASIEISGWQVSGGEARRFFFTGERGSYGAWLGETDNLGVIEAVFFRERERRQPVTRWLPWLHGDRADGRGGPAGEAHSEGSREKASGGGFLADDSAATGIGDRVDHPVARVHLDLERSPSATLRLRYEFRGELYRMGVLPREVPVDPWVRRERSRGFEGSYCPDPSRH